MDQHVRQNVIVLCAKRDPWAEHYFHIPGDGHSIHSCFVKYTPKITNLLAEARTQNYLYNLAQADPRAPRVPKVLDAWAEKGTAYIVMEYVPSPAVTLDIWVNSTPSGEEQHRRTKIAISKVATIISWLHACPLPDKAGIGPVGGGICEHVFFADNEAPMEFATVKALETYVNKALSRAPRLAGAKTISLGEYPLQFCHSDIKWQNFLIRADTLEVWLIDAQHISILPTPFASYALHATRDDFILAVADEVGLKPWHDLEKLVHAAELLQQMGDKSLGLDSNGHVKPLPVWKPVDLASREAAWAAYANPVLPPWSRP